GFRKRLQAGGDVDAIAEQIAALNHDVAKVDADAEARRRESESSREVEDSRLARKKGDISFPRNHAARIQPEWRWEERSERRKLGKVTILFGPVAAVGAIVGGFFLRASIGVQQASIVSDAMAAARLEPPP